MTLIYPNIVPENNLRLPDALTIKHGPAPLLARFVLEGDKAARRMGLRLRLRHDFPELLYFNKQRIPHGDWYRLPNMFHPESLIPMPENSYWISGEDEHGEIVVTQAGRIYYWPESTLEEEARLMFYAGREEGQRCVVTAQDAKIVTGVVSLVRLEIGQAGSPASATFSASAKARDGVCGCPMAGRLGHFICRPIPR